MTTKTIVVALGGNAIVGESGKSDIHEMFANTRTSMGGVAEMINAGNRIVITHGNGPQVGNELIRMELSEDTVPPLPLGVLVGDTEGEIGYMIEQCLMNVLHDKGYEYKGIASLITQVIVDKDAPSIENPTKFVGPFYTEREAKHLRRKRWIMREDSGRGYRRVVPSPAPLEIVNKAAIKLLLDNGFVVIATGGGGIPTYIDERGWHEGLNAVVDKDLASAIMGRDICADILMILTAVEKVALNYKAPEQEELDHLSIEEARRYLDEGQFPAGSMGPKIQAAINFIEYGGERVIITSIDKSSEALHGTAGTVITNR